MASLRWMGSSYSNDCRYIAATLRLARSITPPGLTQAKVLQMPEVRDTMVADGAEPVYSTPGQFGAYIRACHAKWANVIKVSGFKEMQ